MSGHVDGRATSRVPAVRSAFVVLQIVLLVLTAMGPALVRAEPGDESASPPSATEEPVATEEPTEEPTTEPSDEPTSEPSDEQASEPSQEPTTAPSDPPAPSYAPSGPPWIESDLDDYPPGGLVTLTGGNWHAGESVHIFVDDNIGSTWQRSVYVTADDEGSLTDQFNLPSWFVAEYDVIATGELSGVATTSFTDSNPQAIDVVAPTSVTVAQGATAIYGTLTVDKGGNNNPCEITLSVAADAGTGLPSGATAVFGTNPLTMTTSDVTTSLSVTTTGSTAVGTYTFRIAGTNSQASGTGCQGPGPSDSNLLTLVVETGTVTTSTALVSNNDPSTYGDSVTFTATVTGSTNPNSVGTVTFKAGATEICSAVALTGNTAECAISTLSASGSPHSITAEYSGAPGFTGSTSAALSQVVNPKEINITPNAGQSKVYGAADPTLTYVHSPALEAGDSFSGQLARAAGENVGLYAINLGTLSAGSNYSLVLSGVVNFEITARPITVTADAKSKVFGDADPALTFQITSGSLAFSDAFSGALTRATGEDVGTYAITQGTLALSSNYNLTFVGALLTITPKAVVITPGAGQGKVYGETDPVLTFSNDGGLSAGDFTGALGRVAGENVGLYDITLGDLSAGSNYTLDLSSPTVQFEVTARPITVTADAQSKTYGDADPALTYSITSGSLVGGDELTGALTRVAGENVGAYAIQQGSLTAGSNYNLTFVGANLTITARPIEVTADNKSKTYGDADPALTYQITSSSLAFSDDFSGDLVRVSGENVGTYAINQGTLALSSNYNLTFVPGTLTIGQRAIEVTADAKTKVYGDPDPALTFQVTDGALVEGDSFSGALTRVAGETVADSPYAILQGTLTAGTNYDLSYVGANLEITPKQLTGSFTASNKVYDGTTTASVSGSSLPGVVGFDAVVLNVTNARFEDKHVGTGKTVTADLALSGADAGNYELTSDTAATTADITKRPITVTADAQSKTYGDADPALTYQVTDGSLAAGDDFTGALTRDAGEDVGSYAINQGSLAIGDDNNGDNYNLTFVPGTLTITARPITVTADNKSKTYGDADPALTYSITSGSLVGSDGFSGALARDPGENVGSYAITQGTLALSSNYNLTFVPGTLTITARPITVTADAKTKVFGEPDPPLTWQLTSGNLIGTDSITGALTRAAGEAVGSYAIQQGTLTAGTNYNLTFVSANLTILGWDADGHGFYQPVGVLNSVFVAAPNPAPTTAGSLPLISVKGGSTVPLKFNVYADGVEKTSTGDVSNFTAFKLPTCSAAATVDTSENEFETSGNTILRYDSTEGQFVQNWKTPRVGSETCYRTTVTFADGSSLTAFFRLRK